jgi:DNA-binding winged helix-turn-helix (wHTH) protein/Tol biopolymer transport system component
MLVQPRSNIASFGPFQLDLKAGELHHHERSVRLQEQPFQLLKMLLEHPGEVVTRDEIRRTLWPNDTIVEFDRSINAAIKKLRLALRDSAEEPSYVETVARRGYRLIVPVEREATQQSAITSTEEKEQLSSPILGSRTLIRTVAAVLVAAAAVLLVVRFRSPRLPEQKRSIVERQLTANPPENNIGPAAISRDGKYLAYADSLSTNLYLLAIDSGEIREMPLPGHNQPWDWFPDGNHLLTSGAGFDLWKVSALDSSLRQLWRSPAGDVAVSPDGSHIAFVKWPRHEVWLMGADGEEPHQILASDADVLSGLAWSPSGQRLAFIRRRGVLAKHEAAIETCDLTGGARTVLLSDPHLWGPTGMSGISWLPDGRIVYSIYSGDRESNLWALRADPSTGKPTGDSTRLAGWRNFEAVSPQASADGKRLIATRQHTETGIYIGDLASGKKVFSPHRFTQDDWWNHVTDWTKDSKAILFHSKRNGKWAIFKQKIDGKTPETLIAGTENYFRPKLSAQGVLLYSATASPDRWDPRDTTVRLMSTPEQGGARTTLLQGRYEYACGSAPSSSCVVAEFKDGHLIFSHLDPSKGRGEEIARIDGYHSEVDLQEAQWDLSPDGARIAIVGERKGEIRILNLGDRRITVLPVRDWRWSSLALISWAADGKSWFALAGADGSSDALLSIDANGNRRVLHETDDQLLTIVPSPDGKRLAFTKRGGVGDVMLLENF